MSTQISGDASRQTLTRISILLATAAGVGSFQATNPKESCSSRAALLEPASTWVQVPAGHCCRSMAAVLTPWIRSNSNGIREAEERKSGHPA